MNKLFDEGNNKRVYLDYAATTPVDPRVVKAMLPYFTERYGNASSIHCNGRGSKLALDNSRKAIANLMNAASNEIFFTSSATEANNWVLKGHAFQMGKDETHIAISTIEHDCILNSANWLKKSGYRVSYLQVDDFGLIDISSIERALGDGATLVSVIHGNNEIGTVEPIEEIGSLCREHGALFHTDAAQTFGKIPIDVRKMNIDLMTVNAHKLYGPKGVGALFIREGVTLSPLLHGGGQERGRRSSTENVSGIVGFGEAAELRSEEMDEEAVRLSSLRDKLINSALEIPESYLNGHPLRRLPNNVHLRFSYIEGEALILSLDSYGISASTGSACSSHSLDPSHVLLAIGLTPVEAHGSLRLSLGKYNTDDDIDYVLDVLPRSIRRLREISPLTPSELKTQR
jgi:cysteine desulfurase